MMPYVSSKKNYQELLYGHFSLAGSIRISEILVWIEILILPLLSFQGCHVWAVH